MPLVGARPVAPINDNARHQSIGRRWTSPIARLNYREMRPTISKGTVHFDPVRYDPFASFFSTTMRRPGERRVAAVRKHGKQQSRPSGVDGRPTKL
jgi:hypothetical protein